MDHSLLAEVRKAALAKLAEQERLDKAAAPAPTQAATATEVALGQIRAELADEAEEREPGEVPTESTERSPLGQASHAVPHAQPPSSPLLKEAAAALRSRSRTPVVPPASESGGRQDDITMSDVAPGRSAADLALEELGAFQDRQHDNGDAEIDPDAPPAMKASPSGSDESGLEQQQGSEEQPGSAKAAAAAATGLRSRWLAEEPEEPAENGTDAQAEQAEIAALNEAERRDLDGPSPDAAEDENDALLALPVMRAVSMLNACRRVENYERINMISQGTYGIVYRAKEKSTGVECALKKVKISKERDRDGFPLTALREVNVLLSLYHPAIVNVTEVVVGTSLDSVYMVMEFMDHELKALMEEMQQPFSTAEVKCLFKQLLEGVQHLHDNWVIHRDLKTSNILYNNAGELKLCDFGLARQYGSPLKAYTHNVVTLYYRAPELLLGGAGMKYSTAVDMWSCGCIMAELLTKEVLFPARGELDAIDRMFRLLGSPTEERWPGFKQLHNAKSMNWATVFPNCLREKFPRPIGLIETPGTLSDKGFNLLQGLLTLCPAKRLSAEDALQHPWFSEHPLPKDKRLMPTFKVRQRDSSGVTRKPRPAQASPDPRLAARAAEIGSLFDRPAMRM